MYIFWCAITSLYAAAGKLALYEVTKILFVLPILIGIIVFVKKSERGFNRIFAIYAIATAGIGVLSVDAASCNILARIFKVVMSPVSTQFADMGSYEVGVRITGMLSDPNLYSGVMALGTIMSIHLAKSRRSLGAYVLLGLNTLSYVLAFSMGSLFMFLLSCIAMIALEVASKRAALFILLAEDAACTLVMAFIAFAGLGAEGGAKFLPILALCANFVLIWVLDKFIGSKIGDKLANNTKAGIGVIVGIAVVIVGFAVLALNVTGAKTLAPGESLARSAYVKGGDYVLSLDVSQTSEDPADIHIRITSQDETDLKVHTDDVLADQSFGTEGAENQTLSVGFTVPDDSEIVMVKINSASGVTINSATYEGTENGSLKLDYKLLPGFMANRIQNLGANENAIQRTVFFSDGMKLFKMSPVFGRGLGGFENGVMAVQNFFYETKYAHNHYVQMLCDCGLIGLVVFVAMGVIAVLAVVFARRKDDELMLYAVPALGASLV
ncbi:MAG: O-antigen ligase family protein, partial [Firmicutes bacterium]|nr:O-antigen ligase family protein [Bacillota bacterium]